MDSEKRIRAYLRQTQKKTITDRQRRRFNKKVCRDLYKAPMSCGHNMKNCDCPF